MGWKVTAALLNEAHHVRSGRVALFPDGVRGGRAVGWKVTAALLNEGHHVRSWRVALFPEGARGGRAAGMDCDGSDAVQKQVLPRKDTMLVHSVLPS